mmetsp:Transcript_3232/g.6566  ORF Transcript_3232/g.6566 Transcript_3232/m.6566 type:complete len:243 (-) Transcript_3232:104-832(-)
MHGTGGGGGREYPLDLGEVGRKVRHHPRVNAVLLHEGPEEDSPPVHVLGGVGAGEDNAGNSNLEVPDRLTEKVEEVREVRDATDKGRGTVDLNFSSGLVRNEKVIHPTFDWISLDGLLNLSNTVLLAEIHRLIANKEPGVLRKKLVLNCTDLLPQVLRRWLVVVDVIDYLVNIRRGRVNDLAVDIIEGIESIEWRRGRYYLIITDKCPNRIIMPRLGIKFGQVIESGVCQERFIRHRVVSKA